MTRLYTAGIVTETNTFAPFPSSMADFKEQIYLGRGEGVDPLVDSDFSRVFIERGLARGYEVITGVRTFAQPAGRVTRSAYEELCEELISGLRDAMPVDVVFLSLHGAMVAEGEDDCEGDILHQVREVVGEHTPIGVHLDPHCHLTQKMVDLADVIQIWKEYPHTDIAERCHELFDMIEAQLNGKERPIPVVFDCGLIQIFHTTREPMRGFVDRLLEKEGCDGITSISVAHSFPWGDVPSMGTKVLVYAESKSAYSRASDLAKSLGEELWEIREEVATPYVSIDESIDFAYEFSNGVTVISDGADNAGGGAPSDSTYFIDRLLERDLEGWLVGFIYDPGAVRIAVAAGVGAAISLRIGGKVCALSGNPVDVNGCVAGIVTNASMIFSGIEFLVGDAVSVDLGGNRHITLISSRNQTYDRKLFEELGIDLKSKNAIVVKSSQHFYASFSEISPRIIYAAAPGVVTADFGSLPYKNADTTMWPLSEY